MYSQKIEASKNRSTVDYWDVKPNRLWIIDVHFSSRPPSAVKEAVRSSWPWKFILEVRASHLRFLAKPLWGVYFHIETTGLNMRNPVTLKSNGTSVRPFKSQNHQKSTTLNGWQEITRACLHKCTSINGIIKEGLVKVVVQSTNILKTACLAQNVISCLSGRQLTGRI